MYLRSTFCDPLQDIFSTTFNLSPLDGPYGPMTNTVKDNFSGGKVKKIVNVLMAVSVIVYTFTYII